MSDQVSPVLAGCDRGGAVHGGDDGDEGDDGDDDEE